jgi:hypothetical protein
LCIECSIQVRHVRRVRQSTTSGSTPTYQSAAPLSPPGQQDPSRLGIALPGRRPVDADLPDKTGDRSVECLSRATNSCHKRGRTQ